MGSFPTSEGIFLIKNKLNLSCKKKMFLLAKYRETVMYFFR